MGRETPVGQETFCKGNMDWIGIWILVENFWNGVMRRICYRNH